MLICSGLTTAFFFFFLILWLTHEGISNHNYANDLLSRQRLHLLKQKFDGVLFYWTRKKKKKWASFQDSQSTVRLHLIMGLEQLTLGLCFVLYSMAGC